MAMDMPNVEAAMMAYIAIRRDAFERESELWIAQTVAALRGDPMTAAAALAKLIDYSYDQGFVDGAQGMSQAVQALPRRVA